LSFSHHQRASFRSAIVLSQKLGTTSLSLPSDVDVFFIDWLTLTLSCPDLNWRRGRRRGPFTVIGIALLVDGSAAAGHYFNSVVLCFVSGEI
jgi:hypothetical protein